MLTRPISINADTEIEKKFKPVKYPKILLLFSVMGYGMFILTISEINKFIWIFEMYVLTCVTSTKINCSLTG